MVTVKIQDGCQWKVRKMIAIFLLIFTDLMRNQKFSNIPIGIFLYAMVSIKRTKYGLQLYKPVVYA